MPTIISQRTRPAACRQRRRARQRQKRQSITFPHRQRYHRRSLPKPSLKEQSTDVNDCFQDCQELGYHLDPDVHVGSLAAQGNPFSILDSDYSSHSTPDPIPTPYQNHVIRPPNPFLAELEWHVAKKAYPKLEDLDKTAPSKPEVGEEPLWQTSKFWWRSPCQIDDLEMYKSSVSKALSPIAQATIPPSVQTSSIPTSPPSGIDVNLPRAFQQDNATALASRPSCKQRLNDAPSSSFLAEYQIPSPLLYHKPSRDAFPDVDDEDNTCICLVPSIEHAREEHQDIFDSRSTGSSCSPHAFDPAFQVTQPLLQNRYRFVAAGRPNMGTSTTCPLVEKAVLSSDPDFCTNTRPYSPLEKSPVNSKTATGTHSSSTQQPAQPPAKVRKLNTHIYAAEDLRSTDKPMPANGTYLTPASFPRQPAASRQSRPIFRRHDLIFSRPLTSDVCRHKSLDVYFERNINFWSKTQNGEQQKKDEPATLNNDNYVQDRHNKFQELWDAYEKAVLGPKQEEPSNSTHLCVLSEPMCSLSVEDKLPVIGVPDPSKGLTFFPTPVDPVNSTPINVRLLKEIDVPACSLSTCTALLPANLYEKQYLGLTRSWNSDIWNLEQRPLPASNAIVKQTQESRSKGKIQQAVDWLTEDLDLGKMSHDEQEDDGAYLPWLQAGWDSHLLYPEAAASEMPLPLLSPFEDVELGDEGYLADNVPGSGRQVDDEIEEEMWFDWDDDASGWSESSADEFFDFKL